MAETGAGFIKTFREEFSALLGLRWDSFIEWAVITWLSGWFWVTAFESAFSNMNKFHAWSATPHEDYGPITGLSVFLEKLSLHSPRWLTSFLNWLHDPAHDWVYFIFIIISLITCVTSMRSYKHTGLRVLALLSIAIACEMDGSLLPVLWVVLSGLMQSR